MVSAYQKLKERKNNELKQFRAIQKAQKQGLKQGNDIYNGR